MQIESKYKLEKACSNDKTRLVLNSPYFDKENGKMIACDGRMLAVVPVDDIQDNEKSGHVSIDAIKAARKSPFGKTTGKSEIICNGSLKVSTGPEFPREDIGRFPQYEQALPDPKREIKFRVALNPELLLDLCYAIGFDPKSGNNGSFVTLEFHDEFSAMEVKYSRSPDARAILMPGRLS